VLKTCKYARRQLFTNALMVVTKTIFLTFFHSIIFSYKFNIISIIFLTKILYYMVCCFYTIYTYKSVQSFNGIQ
jgi:hypothetical protein